MPYQHLMTALTATSAKACIDLSSSIFQLKKWEMA
jgi:hypothetical protein